MIGDEGKTNKPASLDYHDQLHTPTSKRTYNQRLFRVVAPAYQIVTKVLSWGRDRAWKRALVNGLPDPDKGVVVDLACGTGDIAALVRAKFPRSRIVGLDLSWEMIRVGKSTYPSSIDFGIQDMCRLGVRDSSAAIVTGGYALRNAPDLEGALREIHRMLKPGGCAAFLEFSKPPSPLLQRIELLLLSLWGGFWGWFFHRDTHVYSYLAASLSNFPDKRRFIGMLQELGFANVRTKPRFFGFTALTWAFKAPVALTVDTPSSTNVRQHGL